MVHVGLVWLVGLGIFGSSTLSFLCGLAAAAAHGNVNYSYVARNREGCLCAIYSSSENLDEWPLVRSQIGAKNAV